MLVCKKSPKAGGETRRRSDGAPQERPHGRSGPGEGGPVFLPRRKPSAIARALLAQGAESERVTAYDELWFAGRPAI